MNIINNRWMIAEFALKQIASMYGSASATTPFPLAVHSSQRKISSRFNDVVVINVFGVLMKNDSDFLACFSGTSTKLIRLELQTACADDSVKAVVLNIDSPGGTVDGLAELADDIHRMKQIKPIVAQVDGMCCSAAYYIASQTDAIFCGRMDVVGSIGVILMLADTNEMYKNWGVKIIAITTGKYKAAGVDGVEITPEQIEEFQKEVDIFFNDFKSVILRGRENLSENELNEIADGRVFVGVENITRGLVDGVQGISATIAGINEKASVGAQPFSRRNLLRKKRLTV